MRQCWLCGRKKRKYMQSHHLITRQGDMELTVDLCRGCHFLVSRLAAYTTLLSDSHKVADLITLARYQAQLPDTRTVVRYDPHVL